ncbi:MAG TPA: hypothetical protein VLI90_20745 [Tepidisphaeraceae bacterium]|nr:hypothetical protein [Tepidisphaeraceae bacterium]
MRFICAASVCLALSCLSSFTFAQPAAGVTKPKPDARAGNWLFKTPDPAVWKRGDQAGATTFNVDLPPGDFCTLTLFAGGNADADLIRQFNTAIAEDQKAKGAVKIDGDSGPKPSKSAEGFDVLTRTIVSETNVLHTYNLYITGHSGGRFDMAAFQTSSEEMWKRYGPQASQFLLSLKLANSLDPAEVERLVGKPADTGVQPPALPGFGDAPAADTVPAPAAAPTENVPDVPLDRSPIVKNNAVTDASGKGIDGIKLSQHDTDIGSPSIAVAPDGTIHIAFVEEHRTTYKYAVYHRMSKDGGRTWTEAKNLTEDMPTLGVGKCFVLADAQNRIYVTWRAGIADGFSADVDQRGGRPVDLYFRVLENGKWTKAKRVNEPPDVQRQTDAPMNYYANVDAAGRVQVIWILPPDKWHPELLYHSQTSVWHANGIGTGLIYQAMLDGANVVHPHEIFLPAIGDNGNAGKFCDGLDIPTGYFDAAGNAHLLANATSITNPVREKSRFELIENGKAGPIIDVPALSFHAWRDIPVLLYDAQGRRHMITLYLAGERPGVRDYLIGSDDEPTVIRAAAAVKGTVDGLQAYQGPGGRMIAIMQMNDTGDRATGETYVSISNGSGWGTPINVTNNAGRRSFASKQTSARSNVAVEKSYYPGPAAAAIDKDGHLLLLMINNEYGLFASTAFGVEMAGGSSSTPMLQFLKF